MIAKKFTGHDKLTSSLATSSVVSGTIDVLHTPAAQFLLHLRLKCGDLFPMTECPVFTKATELDAFGRSVGPSVAGAQSVTFREHHKMRLLHLRVLATTQYQISMSLFASYVKKNTSCLQPYASTRSLIKLRALAHFITHFY